MSEDSGAREDSTKKKNTRKALEETFSRYMPPEVAPAIPKVEEEAPAARAEAAPERIVPKLEIPAPSIVSTGIAGLDDMLAGGLSDHSLILVSGEPGSQYETFVNQVLYNHVSKDGKAAYYLAETLSTDVKQNMEQYGWHIRDYMERGSWIFVNLRTEDLQKLADLSPPLFAGGFRIPLTRSLDSLKTDLLTKIKEERWTVLELSHILSHYDLKDVTSLILYWRATIRVHGGVHFAMLPLGVHPENVSNSLEQLADGVLEFRQREGPREYETVMMVRKLRNLRKPLIITYTVEDYGILIETAARIT